MPSTLITEFAGALARYQETLEADEWYFARLRESLVNPLSPAEAFALSNDVVALLLQQSDQAACSECGALLLDLARHADTSEIPPALEKEWDPVVLALAGDSQTLEELRQWYRRPAA